ncbi:hypothetical protein SAMN06265365_13065 [Tistlia consotensis]|uniref:Uncharacterized protein n=1 Tax=Tistlia consotensis USBA 355 TaxID=560819 RepID=A0A1Y6CL32_9PROT|nr:hypothetical protein [Tistlia consotensis]SMF72851.1 hypothetical protein SAMN05428998_13165 [Tistlia consotensis USBA 355]SNS09850.1 hypothetical protein SAMN06265365_13065 [Tistlia consotensis]
MPGTKESKTQGTSGRLPGDTEEAAPDLFPGDTTAVTPLSKAVVEVTNRRYQQDPFWGGPKGIEYGKLVGALPIQLANLYPDQGTTYFVGEFHLPKGSYLTIHGEYGHQRYFSYTVAAQLGNGQLGNGDFLRDDQIDPDSGSHNPFRTKPHNDRDVTPRKFTLWVRQGQKPKVDCPKNTLYTGFKSESARVHLAIRNYIPDAGYDGTGNAELQQVHAYGLPEVRLHLPDIKKPLGGKAMAKAVRASKAREVSGFSRDGWLWLVRNSVDPINAPAAREPAFQRFWNTSYSMTGAFIPDPALRERLFPATGAGGFANNPDTIYLMAAFSLDFGEVVVMQGKMPSHQRTRHRQKKWIRDTQVRYWSVTAGTAPPDGIGWGSLFDEEVPLDGQGNFTIVMSWPENRPANATKENGVAWLDFGGGEGHFTGARAWVNFVYFRYMAPNPDWPESPANIPLPTVEQPVPQDAETMQQYYPRATYMTKAAFEALGSNPTGS